MLPKILAAWFLAWSIPAFTVMAADKLRAKKHLRRIPEKTLFAFAWIGGGLGSVIGMFLLRHKTKHTQFRRGLPAILAGQVLLLAAALVLTKKGLIPW